MSFPSRAEYESLIYGLLQTYPDHIAASTLRLYSTSALTARVVGTVYLNNGLQLRVTEFVDFMAGRILDYSYTIYQGENKIRWYDPQVHPENLALAETFPHHYHESPDIKHNRHSAPGISFHSPNLPALIADCIQLGKTVQGKEF
jgi:hypothetical protein